MENMGRLGQQLGHNPDGNGEKIQWTGRQWTMKVDILQFFMHQFLVVQLCIISFMKVNHVNQQFKSFTENPNAQMQTKRAPKMKICNETGAITSKPHTELDLGYS